MMIPLRELPQYVEQLQALNKLVEALAKVQGRVAEIESLLRQPAQEETHAARVDAAISFAETGVVRAAGFDAASLNHEHLELRSQREALEVAIRAKHEELHRIAGAVSVERCAEVEAKHRQLAKRFLDKLLELDALQEEELQLLTSIERAGYQASFREYVRWPHLGMLRDSSAAPIWHRVRELRHYSAN